MPSAGPLRPWPSGRAALALAVAGVFEAALDARSPPILLRLVALGVTHVGDRLWTWSLAVGMGIAAASAPVVLPTEWPRLWLAAGLVQPALRGHVSVSRARRQLRGEGLIGHRLALPTQYVAAPRRLAGAAP